MTLLIILMIFHWIGDFLLQTRNVAENKGKDVGILLWHVGMYSYCLMFGLGVYNLLGASISNESAIGFFLTNFALHLYIDSQTSQITSYFHKKGNMHGFFSTIGADQALHMISLIWTANLFIL